MLKFPGLRRRPECISIGGRTDVQQYQPIHLAASEGNDKLVKLHLKQGANVNARIKHGHFPLYIAAANRKPAVLKTLLEHGAHVNQRTTFDGRTALHEACRNSDQECIKILVSAGADMLVEDNDGNTPFATLFGLRDLENPIIRLMIKLLALKKVCLQSPTELNDERMIKRSPRVLWDYYRDCVKQIERMKITRIIGTCTFFELLTRSHCDIAALMRSPEFLANFGQYDLSEFSIYAEDLSRAFERAQNYYNSMLEQEDIGNESAYVTDSKIWCPPLHCVIC